MLTFVLAWLAESTVLAQIPVSASAPAEQTAEVERVIVTGSNIPTAEETGPIP